MSIPRSTLISNFVYVAYDLNIQVLDDIIKKYVIHKCTTTWLHTYVVCVCMCCVCVYISHMCVCVYK